MLWSTGSWAQKWNRCDPRYYFITRADCTTYGEQAAKSMAELRQAIGEESVKIAAARKRFWETYPDKPGSAETRDEFARKLEEKDLIFAFITLMDAFGGVKAMDIIGGKTGRRHPALRKY